MRVGIGMDVHAFAPARRLVVGGVEIPYEQGLLGHSDADVLAHAIADAVLGGAGLGDIGQHFPDDDPAYKDADSLILLAKCAALAQKQGYAVGNVDAVILAEKPKMAPYTQQMRQKLAAALGILPERVNIKATTTERLGFVGREEGMAAQAVCLLERI